MKIRQLASRALPLAIAGLLMAVGAAAAGDYSPERLRAESFLRLRTMDYEPGAKRGLPIGDRPMIVGVDYPIGFASGDLRMRFGAGKKLRQLVRFELYY